MMYVQLDALSKYKIKNIFTLALKCKPKKFIWYSSENNNNKTKQKISVVYATQATAALAISSGHPVRHLLTFPDKKTMLLILLIFLMK